MGYYEAIIFDMDGVLVDSEPLFHGALNSRLIEEGAVPISLEEYRLLIGSPIEETWRQLKELRDLPRPIAEYTESYRSMVNQILQDGLNPRSGVAELVTECQRRRLPIAVASSSLRLRVDLTLESIGLQDAFDVVLGGEDVARSKPEPDIYLLAAERLGIPSNQCIAIEDSPLGIDSAVSAGAYTIAVRTGYTEGLDISRAATVLNSLTDFDYSLLTTLQ